MIFEADNHCHYEAPIYSLNQKIVQLGHLATKWLILLTRLSPHWDVST